MNREASPSRPLGLRRRTILAGAAVALPAWSHTAPQLSAAQRARLGVTTVCFRGRYAVNFPGAPKTAGENLLGAPRFIRDTLGLSNVELWSLQFESDTPDYCDRLRAAAQAAGSRIINIQLDGPYDFSSPDADQRAKSLDYVKGWMNRARRLGSPSLRANFSGLQSKGPFPLQQVAEAFRQLAAYGRSIGVKVLVENHIGHSVSVDNVVAVLKAVDDPWCRAIADWGNSPAKNFADRLAQMARLSPWLELVSAKGLHFDAQGRHLDYDVAALTRATEAAGFGGIYSIELFAGPEPPADPIAQAKALEVAIAPNLKPAKPA